MRLSLVFAAVFAVSCAQELSSPAENLFENHSSTSDRVRGLSRVNTGAFVQGTTESLRAVYVSKGVKTLEWTATAGALSSSGDSVTWSLPDTDSASLTLTLVMDDGARIDTRFDFALVTQPNPDRPVKSAQEALLATPMPVLDGGSEISGGACELEYDSSANVHLVFTTGTHPALYYAKWNGTAWTIEVVDAMGFNTGGAIATILARIKVDGSGNPHIVYARDGQLRYATRTGTGAWTMERIDTAQANNGQGASLALNASGRPSVLYQTYNGSASPFYRPAIATRTAANTWTNTSVYPTTTGSYFYPTGDLLIDGAGTSYFPMYNDYNSTNLLLAWNGTTVSSLLLNSESPRDVDYPGAAATWAGANRLLLRTERGVYDIGINTTTFSSSTQSWWALEQSGASVGDIAWNGKPVVLHHHGPTLELVTTANTGASFWTWQQLGSSSDVSASVAVHPTTGAASICYQANGRIMFQ